MVTKTFTLNHPWAWGSSGYYNQPNTALLPKWNNGRTYVNTPGFRAKRKAREELPMNPYEQQIIEYMYQPGSRTFWRPDVGAHTKVLYYGLGAVVTPPQLTMPLSGYHDVLYNKCLGKIPRRVNGAQFNLPLFVKEWKQTAKMVTDLSRDIATKFKGVNRGSRDLQNLWLEYRYGWRLAVMDIYDGLCAVHDLRTRSPSFRVRAECQTNTSWVGTPSPVTWYGPLFSPTADIRLDCSATWGTTLAIRYRDPHPWLGTLQQFGITNPIGLLWEIIPYSFVIDWLIPVSDYLQTLDTWYGKEFVSGCRTDWWEYTYKTTSRNFLDQYQPAWVPIGDGLPSVITVRRRFFKRTVLSSFPSASLPDIQLSLNASRMTDAVALMLQRVKPAILQPFLSPRSH